ncbi:tripartite tricarboxylate transporter TctB family protein [uncultured Tateyamaria sp.]|uniref:tripartite tricarboxylate transporter TctB family protein n=1 Tax=uncultured Tateyamaria sp. TaxID=455651 RepID=UPI0026321F73|nr:tripartite tricarboxylate transporter TctB family protein [uncultured Tateyamaria sp.]
MTRFAVPSGIISVCGLAFWLSTQFDKVPPILLRGMQPADFPQMVLILIIVLSICVALFDRPTRHDPIPAKVWISLALFVVFALTAQIDLFLGLGVFACTLAYAWGERRPWALGTVALISPALIFFLFDQVFNIRFPRGLLTNLWYG